MYRPVLVTPPAETPVSRTEAKAHLRVEHTSDDTLIDGLIAAAVSHLDGWTGILGRCLVTQTWRQDFDCFERCLRLPLFPVQSITSVKYTDTAGAEQTVTSTEYSLMNDDLGAYVEFKSTYAFPSVSSISAAVRVAYVAGYGAASTVPAGLKNAIFIQTKMGYNPLTAEEIAAYQKSFDALVAPFRRMRF